MEFRWAIVALVGVVMLGSLRGILVAVACIFVSNVRKPSPMGIRGFGEAGRG